MGKISFFSLLVTKSYECQQDGVLRANVVNVDFAIISVDGGCTSPIHWKDNHNNSKGKLERTKMTVKRMGSTWSV